MARPTAGPVPGADRSERPEAAQRSGAPRRRLFFALWPPPSVRTALVRATRRAVRRSGGRPVAPADLHVTLAFIGASTPAELERLLELPPLGVGPFELTLGRLGFLERAGILWLAPEHVPERLASLEQRLWAWLIEQGHAREPRLYRPHVTLVRRGRAVDEPIRPITWAVERFALVESLPPGRPQSRARYRPLDFRALE